MNKGLVVNSEPEARVWSLPLLLAIMLFPTLCLKAAFVYRVSLLLGVARSRQRLVCPVLWLAESESKIEKLSSLQWSGTLSNRSAAPKVLQQGFVFAFAARSQPN